MNKGSPPGIRPQIQPHAATVVRPSTPHAATVVRQRGPHPATVLRKAMPERAQRSAAQVDHRTPTIQRVRSKRFTESESEYLLGVKLFNEMRDKGTLLYKNIEDALGNPFTSDVDTYDQFNDQYATEITKNPELPINILGILKAPKAFVQLDTRSKNAEVAAYTNFMDPINGQIIAGSNYANKDKAVKRLNNSEILFHQYRLATKLAQETGISTPGLSGVTEVIRSSIQNATTMKVVDMCFTKVSQKVQPTTYAANTEEFCAILATDNCKGISFLVSQHPNELGWKTIGAIVTGGLSYIRILLEGVTPPKLPKGWHPLGHSIL